MKESRSAETEGEKKNHSDSLIRAAARFPQGKEQTEEESEKKRDPDKRVNHNKYL